MKRFSKRNTGGFMNGIINIYKEKGFTSHDVVAKLRGIVKQKKIGHTGTLDPDAEGVLPVCLGNATKVCQLLTDKDKAYEAVLKLGITTDTQDMTGMVQKKVEVTNTIDEINRVIKGYEGTYHQIPPMYSAIKIGGKKLYQLAREGKEVERSPREVIIHKIEILEENMAEQEITIRVSCSKGTYIRTLCHDIGMDLGCGGCMKTLLRTRAGNFKIEDSITLAQVEELQRQGELEQYLIKIDEIFSDYRAVTLKDSAEKLIQNGNLFTETDIIQKYDIREEEQVRVYDSQGRFQAIYKYKKEIKVYKPVKMFLTTS